MTDLEVHWVQKMTMSSLLGALPYSGAIAASMLR